MPTKTNNLAACPECDALQRLPALAPDASARCVRCGAELGREKPECLQHTLALMGAAAIAFACANAFPILELDANGIHTESTIYGLVKALFESGWPTVALIVLVTVILVPVVQLATTIYVLASLQIGRIPLLMGVAVRTMDAVWRWGMVEVFLLGAMVSMVRLTKIADVYVGFALYAVGAYVVLMTAAVAAFDTREIWDRAEELRA
jgi:paraquat-inducible protein A